MWLRPDPVNVDWRLPARARVVLSVTHLAEETSPIWQITRDSSLSTNRLSCAGQMSGLQWWLEITISPQRLHAGLLILPLAVSWRGGNRSENRDVP